MTSCSIRNGPNIEPCGILYYSVVTWKFDQTTTIIFQEPILEPVSVRCDLKRAVSYQQLVTINSYRDLLACDADVAVDTVLLNVGQKDLATMLAVWTDNLSEGHYIGTKLPFI